MKLKIPKSETCSICGCKLVWGNKNGQYAKDTIAGRSHGTAHHHIPERFYGRTANKPKETRTPIFNEGHWGDEYPYQDYCYECHEELLHNPILVSEDLIVFRKLVELRGLDETEKPESREKIAGRIMLFHESIAAGLKHLLSAHLSAIQVPTFPPEKFILHIGGYFGTSHVIEFDGSDLIHKTFEGGGRGHKVKRIEVSREGWENFIADCDEIGVWSWLERYQPMETILDGSSWRVEIQSGARRVDSSGSNASPKGFSRFLEALGRLAGQLKFV